MCGIVGIFVHQGIRPVDEAVLHKMNEALVHRGPDDGGVHIEPGVGLGHRRLSIIDMSGGHQPIYNEDKSVSVVFNGEIYNYQELKTELERAGHLFCTDSDTEVIVHGWEQWGEDCVHHFRGMFAFAIWDKKKETLFLARDRVGIKPLYYAFLPSGELIFGSELKALLVHPKILLEIDPCSVEDYFGFGYVPEPRSIFKDIFKLSPGHTLYVQRYRSVPSERQYWDISFNSQGMTEEAEVAEELVGRLREAVNSHMISEAPLGAFLSGGVDSSAVVAMMADLSSSAVSTCSMSFDNKGFDESDYALRVSRRYKTKHYSEEVDIDDFDLLDSLIDIYDEPFADSSAIPTYRVCQLAKKRVTVVLSGDGGDENFAGYRRYQWHMQEQRRRERVPDFLKNVIFRPLSNIYPHSPRMPRFMRAKPTLTSLSVDATGGYFNIISLIKARDRSRIFSKDFLDKLQGYRAVDVLNKHSDRFKATDSLSLVQYLDMKTYLVGDILTKVDRASMAHSLEVRVPFLDHRFMEWAAGIDSSLKYKGSETKYLLKKSLEPYLDEDILYRKKMGFAVPVGDWLRGPLRARLNERLIDGALGKTGMFNISGVKKLMNEHFRREVDHASALWALLIFEAFMNKYEL